ncbi:DUF4259 domain-containing protein [Streptomyces glaucescens]
MVAGLRLYAECETHPCSSLRHAAAAPLIRPQVPQLPLRASQFASHRASALPDSPIVIDPDDGPSRPLPELPASLRASARLALDRVLRDGSEMATGWVDSADADQWRQEVRQILQALETPADH